jgi:hypothetical protein
LLRSTPMISAPIAGESGLVRTSEERGVRPVDGDKLLTFILISALHDASSPRRVLPDALECR